MSCARGPQPAKKNLIQQPSWLTLRPHPAGYPTNKYEFLPGGPGLRVQPSSALDRCSTVLHSSSTKFSSLTHAYGSLVTRARFPSASCPVPVPHCWQFDTLALPVCPHRNWKSTVSSLQYKQTVTRSQDHSSNPLTTGPKVQNLCGNLKSLSLTYWTYSQVLKYSTALYVVTNCTNTSRAYRGSSELTWKLEPNRSCTGEPASQLAGAPFIIHTKWRRQNSKTTFWYILKIIMMSDTVITINDKVF